MHVYDTIPSVLGSVAFLIHSVADATYVDFTHPLADTAMDRSCRNAHVIAIHGNTLLTQCFVLFVYSDSVNEAKTCSVP